LRQRKIDETDNKVFSLLKLALTSPDIVVVYSHVILNEIQQIRSEKYKNEHILLLDELDAKYIEPLRGGLSNKSVSEIWQMHLENIDINKKMGILDLEESSHLLFRKISGLPIEYSFDDINEKCKLVIAEIISYCEQQLSAIDINTLDELTKENFLTLTSQLSLLKAQSNALQALKVESTQELGPKPFRDNTAVKALEIYNLPAYQVVSAIESTFKNGSFNWEDYFENTPQNAVAKAFCLMNWAGYYPDDFDKVKKRGDRFNASNNDMQHVVSALGVNFLLSNDIAFLKKAEACYAYINENTAVCSPKQFLVNHCKFVK